MMTRAPFAPTRCPAALLASLLLALTALPAEAQKGRRDEPAQGTFEETSQVVAVEVPIHVVDRDGRPVRGLEAKDFTVFDEGRRQEITGFEVIDLEQLEPGGERAGEVARRIEELGSSARRHFLLLFDLSFSRPTSILKARLAARDWILDSLHPSDLVAVATYTVEGGPKLVMTFTPDRAQLARAIDTLGLRDSFQAERADPLRFIIEPPGEGPVGSGVQVGDGADLRAQRDQALLEHLQIISNAADKVERSFAVARITSYTRGLGALARVLDSVQGRKQVVFFSEGFDSNLLLGRDTLDQQAQTDTVNAWSGRNWLVDSDTRYGSMELQTDLRRMAEEFQRADCVIQAVHVGGLRSGGDASGRGAAQGEETLFYMANETGGELFKDTNDLDAQLDRLLARTNVTYLLTFQRSDVKPDGSFHRLRVKADVPGGARLSHRAGYYAPRPFQDLHPLEKALLASNGIASARPRRDIPLSLLAAPFRSTEALAYVPVIVEIPGEALLAGQQGERLNLEIYAYASDARGQMRDFLTQFVGVDLKRGRKALEKTGVKYYGHLDLPPGDYRLRVLVRNAETGRSGIETARIEVPAYEQAQPVLLPPFFMEETQQWLMVREETGRGPQATVVYPFTVSGEPYVPAARPEMRGDGQARLCLVAYNLGAGDLAVHGQVMGSDGTALPAGRLARVERTATGISGLDKLVATFEPSGLQAGDYVLQVAVTDPATGHREVRSQPFRVLPD
jgi:VWFA-related protein